MINHVFPNRKTVISTRIYYHKQCSNICVVNLRFRVKMKIQNCLIFSNAKPDLNGGKVLAIALMHPDLKDSTQN